MPGVGAFGFATYPAIGGSKGVTRAKRESGTFEFWRRSVSNGASLSEVIPVRAIRQNRSSRRSMPKNRTPEPLGKYVELSPPLGNVK